MSLRLGEVDGGSDERLVDAANRAEWGVSEWWIMLECRGRAANRLPRRCQGAGSGAGSMCRCRLERARATAAAADRPPTS